MHEVRSGIDRLGLQLLQPVWQQQSQLFAGRGGCRRGVWRSHGQA